MLKPLHDNIIIEAVEVEKTTASGIILSGDAAKPNYSEGVVIAIGSGKLLPNGERAPLMVEVNQRVIFNSYSGTKVSYQGKDLIILTEEEILATVEG